MLRIKLKIRGCVTIFVVRAAWGAMKCGKWTNVSVWYLMQTGILRYKVDFQSLQADEPLDDVDLDEY